MANHLIMDDDWDAYVDQGLVFQIGEYQLHHTCHRGDAQALQVLLESGFFNVNEGNYDLNRPLHEACLGGHYDCAVLLCSYGADVNLRNIDGATALCEACSRGSLECIELLLQKSAAVNLPFLLITPLHEAILGNNWHCLPILIKHGARLEASDLDYGTPLQTAVSKGYIECARILLKAGSHVNVCKNHLTPLHAAARGGNFDMLYLLLEYGADVYLKDAGGRTAIQLGPVGKQSILDLLQHHEVTFLRTLLAAPKMSFPCTACGDNSGKECNSCKGWIQQRCVPVTYDLLKVWDLGDLPFACHMFAFDQGAYSATKALERLKKASLSPQQARAERRMLKTYSIDLPNSVHMSSTASTVGDVSEAATKSSYYGLMAESGITAALSVSIQSDCPPNKGAYFLSKPLARSVRGRGVSERKDPALILMWTCALTPRTNNAFIPNYFVVLYVKREPPVLDLTFISDANNDDEQATVAAVNDDNYDDDDDMPAVANVSDDADDTDPDKDDNFVSTAPKILPGGKSLPHGNFLEPKGLYNFCNMLQSMRLSVQFQGAEKTMFILLSETKATRTGEPKVRDPNSGMTEERGRVIVPAEAILFKKMEHSGQSHIDKAHIVFSLDKTKSMSKYH